MKRMRFSILLLTVILALLLAGCGKKEEDRHPDWPGEWFRIHPDLGVETPENFSLNESNDLMSVSGLYYATWTTGEGREIKNPQGQDATVYDAQLYVLLKECNTDKNANTDIADWMAREAQSYEAGQELRLKAAGQTWRVMPLLAAKSENPYHHGTAAFAVRDGNAICVELFCTEAWAGDPEAVLEAFLEGFHYGFGSDEP